MLYFPHLIRCVFFFVQASIYKMLDHAKEKHIGPDLRGTYLVEKETNMLSVFFRSRGVEKGEASL